MRIPPASVWATWPEPNYSNPTTRGPALLIVNVILITIVTIAVLGRLYNRASIKRWFGADDAMIIPAFVLDVGLTTVVLLANYQYGWDRHIWDLPFTWIPPAQKIAFAAKILFTLAATFIRLSLICFYYRLVAQSTSKWYYWVLHVSVAWIMAVCVTFIALTIWLCSPIQAYWIFPPTGYCMSEGKAMLGGGIVNSVSDLWTTILPVPIIMRLKMPLRQRVGVCILLCMGVIATVAGAVRTYYTWKSLMVSWDETWWAYWLWVAAAIEIHLGMICACAPAWKSILQEPLKKLSCKISSKLSSLRSPSTTRNSSTVRPGIFDPLRSLPWFQHTRFDFERTQRGSDEDGLEAFEDKFGASDKSSGAGATDSSNANSDSRDGTPNNRASVASANRQITMRQSIEQFSEQVAERPAD